MKSTKFRLFLVLIAVTLVIQFVPYGPTTNPLTLAEPAWDSLATRELFLRSCGDCHSHQTRWPWYSSVAPVSWLVRHDVDEGREHFNVSAWGWQRKNKGNEAAKEVREGKMPPLIYLFAHTEARLSDDDKAFLVRGLVATFGDKRDD